MNPQLKFTSMPAKQYSFDFDTRLVVVEPLPPQKPFSSPDIIVEDVRPAAPTVKKSADRKVSPEKYPSTFVKTESVEQVRIDNPAAGVTVIYSTGRTVRGKPIDKAGRLAFEDFHH